MYQKRYDVYRYAFGKDFGDLVFVNYQNIVLIWCVMYHGNDNQNLV